ncbi:unnamed protein product [Microthlaspi erraticum]|uniref:SWIM-type domain-containing protein n=1 Tax=Microthlaspi erraticum TaxID=1685480 RepID=A0A6D2KXZ1_9BRAS|nr:unnamed protein product [Microthlaspi erraticum]
MALEDYSVSKIGHRLEISYPLPEVFTQQKCNDSLPVFVTNDRQVESLIELSRPHVVRLCVSSKGKDEDNVDGPLDEDLDENLDDELKEEFDEELEEDWTAEREEMSEESGCDEDDVREKAYEVDDDTHADYSQYGKIKDEEVAIEVPFDDPRLLGRGVGHRIGIDNWEDNIYEHQSFDTKDQLISELRLTAVMTRFSFRIAASTRKVFVAKCKVAGCAWRLRAAVKNEPSTFWVTKYVKSHTFSVSDRVRKHKRCTTKYIGKLFLDRTGHIEGIVPQHIRDSMRRMFGMKLDYTASYKALKHAQDLVWGTAEEGYANLPSYLQRIKEADPGTVTDLVCDSQDRFKYCFLSLAGSIAGFQYLRRVIVVDGTHLTGKYGGALLVAAGQDANFQIFPLAFAMVHGEDNESWEWFFNKLRDCFRQLPPMAIVSDRAAAIARAIGIVMPWASRGICYYHLQGNIVKDFHAKEIMYMVKGSAYAHTVPKYDRYMDLIIAANPSLAVYLESADPKLWSRVHFEGNRYNIKTSNIAESINSAVKKPKGLPIPRLLEFIREKLGRWFSKRREDALSLTTRHSRGVEYILAIRSYYAGSMIVNRIDTWRFHVKGGRRDCNVDLENRTCSCGVYNVEKILCSHVIAAAAEANIDMSYYVCATHSTPSLFSTYASPIYPKAGTDSHVKPVPCLPPGESVPRGRPKKSRWQTWLEMSRKKNTKPRKTNKKYSCSKCKEPGHTRPNCVAED